MAFIVRKKPLNEVLFIQRLLISVRRLDYSMLDILFFFVHKKLNLKS